MKPPANDSAGDILTREQVAKWLQVKPRQVERLKVPAIPLGRKTVRYDRAEVAAWLEQQKQRRAS